MSNSTLYANPNAAMFYWNDYPADVASMLVVTGTSNRVEHLNTAGYTDVVYEGSGFTISGGNLSGGTITTLTGYKDAAPHSIDFITTGLNVPVSAWLSFASSNDGLGLMKYLYGGDDVISNDGNYGPSIIAGYGGNDTIIGGTLTDTAVYLGTRSEYTVTNNGNGSYSIADQTISRDGTDTLTNVERLSFADGTLGLDTSGTSGQMYRLYKAAFNRVPDAPGLGWNINLVDNGLTLAQMSAAFVASAEFTNTYGALSNTQFLDQLYLNVLGRPADPVGAAWNLNLLDTNAVDRPGMLAAYSESAENQLAVIGQIQDGIWFT